MERKLSWSLFAAAIGLFAFIYFVERRIPGTAERRAPQPVLPFGNPQEIRTIQVNLPGEGVVRAERSNGSWVLSQPRYPARELALDTFATNLVRLRSFDRIPTHEANLQGAKAFGLEPPRAVIDVQGVSNSIRLEIGGTAPLSSNVYVRLPRSGEVLLASGTLLAGLPRSTNAWRSPELFDLKAGDYDRIQIRSGQRSFELARVATNNLWQISRPVPARADQDRILQLLQIFQSVEATEFVTDGAMGDLERFGLQRPDAEITFSRGTNRVYSIEFGNAATNRPNQVFARLIGQTNVVLAPRQLADFLKQDYKSFHDPRLVTINAASLDRVVVHARENFTLQKNARTGWTIDDAQKTPVDRALLNKLANTANSMQILDIVKELPTEADLKSTGLLPPIISYVFFEKLTNASGITTNILFSELNFGAAQADKIYVRRSDENPIYLTQLPALLELPKRAFEMRDRRIWHLATNAITRISVNNGLVTNDVVRGPAGWSTDPIVSAQIDEIAFRLSNLTALEWVEKGSARLATFGVNDKSLRLRVQTTGTPGAEDLALHFGRQTLRRDVYASVVFPGDTEPTIFEFPGDLFQLMLEALPVPK